MNKICNKCKENRLLHHYSKKTKGKDGLNGICKLCIGIAAKQRYQQDPTIKERSKSSSRLYTAKKFGLTPEELGQFYATQNSKCAICGITEDEHKKFFAIDHDHATGKVRGLLCMACNTGLGNFRDNQDLLNLAMKYLKDKS